MNCNSSQCSKSIVSVVQQKHILVDTRPLVKNCSMFFGVVDLRGRPRRGDVIHGGVGAYLSGDPRAVAVQCLCRARNVGYLGWTCIGY